MRRRHFKIQKILTAEQIAVCERMLADGKTYGEIRAYIFGQSQTDISLAAISRWNSNLSRTLEKLKRAQETAAAIFRESENKPISELSEASQQIATQQILEYLIETENLMEGVKGDRLITALARLTEAANNSARTRMLFESGVNRAADKIKAELRAELERDPELAARLGQRVDEAAKTLTQKTPS